MQRARAVAVVGAGAAGLVAARELLHEGHAVTVFESSDHVGGTWAYDPRPDGPDPVASSNGVHGGSSMYASLRTNLPRELMGFSSHESLAGRVFAGDPRAFPSHGEVLAFLRAFAEESGVARHVRLRADVVRVAPPVGRPGEEEERWSVAWRGESGEVAVEVFDAVVVCNGHCTVPLVPKLRGIGKWRGKQMHSHNYRIPEPFRDQVDCIQDDGQVRFAQGAAVTADTILYCTGYRYHFPFLDLDDLSVDEDNRVGPLYKHVFPPKYAPNLSFVGLPVKAIPFQSFELESKWVARVLSGRAALPSEEGMLAAVREHYRRMEERGKPRRHTHVLMPEWVEYMDWVAEQVGEPRLEVPRRKMYERALECIWSLHGGYRDSWEGGSGDTAS